MLRSKAPSKRRIKPSLSCGPRLRGRPKSSPPLRRAKSRNYTKSLEAGFVQASSVVRGHESGVTVDGDRAPDDRPSIDGTPPPLVQLDEIPRRLPPLRGPPAPAPREPAPPRLVAVEARAAGPQQLPPLVDSGPDVGAPAPRRISKQPTPDPAPSSSIQWGIYASLNIEFSRKVNGW